METKIKLNEAAVEEAAKAICPNGSAWEDSASAYRDDARVAIQTYLEADAA